jgi:type IV pilus assembly protein PilV
MMGEVKRTKGFTLIEVLVSVLLLAVGLLGLASLQMVSLKNNQSAQYRTEATLAAYDIVDRMRVNRVVALAQGYDVGLGGAAAGDALAVADVTNWKLALAASFNGGDGIINTDPATGIVTVTVQWDDSRGSRKNTAAAIAAAREQQFSVSTQL